MERRKFELVCENQTSFKNGLRIRGQNGNNARKIGHDSNDLMETVKTSVENQMAWNTKETQQDLEMFTDYDEKQRGKHKLD